MFTVGGPDVLNGVRTLLAVCMDSGLLRGGV